MDDFNKRKSGFSVVEILIIIAVIIVITAIAVVFYGKISSQKDVSSGANSKDSNSNAVAVVSDYITIGSQTWATRNLNVGTIVKSVYEQKNNDAVEKTCYDNLESNCEASGAFYQWDEAMKYTKSEGAQGICPTGSHIPSDNDWKILEIQLGMSQKYANATGFRGTDQGKQMKLNGSSGLNIPFSGSIFGPFSMSANQYAMLWTSSIQDDTNNRKDIWIRTIESTLDTVDRDWGRSDYGYSIRCLKN